MLLYRIEATKPSFAMASNGNGNVSEQKAHRDVKNHLLFEIATEVAHRGTRQPSNQLTISYLS